MDNLKQAREQGKIGQFAKERDKGDAGDETLFNATLQAMAGISTEAPEASCEAPDGD